MVNSILQQYEILNSKIHFFSRIKIEDHLNALNKISELGNINDIKYVFHHILSKHEKIRRKIPSIIRILLLKEQPNLNWLGLYDIFSYIYLEDKSDFSNFNQLNNLPQEEAVHILGILSLNHNGYLREEALNRIAKLTTPEAIPYILMRLNDWVEEVRNIANKALDHILPITPVDVLLKYYSLIKWLGRPKRIDLKDVQSRIFKYVSAPENREAVLLYLDKVKTKERIFWLNGLRSDIKNEHLFIDKLITDTIPEIRVWGVRNLTVNDKFHERIIKLLTDKVAKVRCEALKCIPQAYFSDYNKYYELALFDKSKAMRDYARFCIRNYSNENIINLYRKQLVNLKNAAPPGLLAGLAEVATHEDVQLILPYTNHQDARVREAVLRCLNRLAVKDIDDLYLNGLVDQSSRVRGVCIKILAISHRSLEPQLLEILQTGSTKAKRLALKVINKWLGLEGLLATLIALNDTDIELKEMAWQYLVSWHNWYNHFSFGIRLNQNIYNKIDKLLTELRAGLIEVPHFARYAWDDLPNLINLIAKSKI